MGTLESQRGGQWQSPPGHQKAVSGRLCLGSGDKEDLKTEKENRWGGSAQKEAMSK